MVSYSENTIAQTKGLLLMGATDSGLFSPWVIIPAHNESMVIRKTLDTLLAEQDISFNTIVVCNGCTDKTAEIIRSHYPNVVCEEIDMASKATAIRYAESLNIGFPRLYLDADICLPGRDAKRLFEAAKKESKACLILPSSKLDLDGVSFWVKAYYQVWYQSPFVKEQGFGCGAYVLNNRARSRFGDWPELVADDGFVRLFVEKEEITILKESNALVKVPKLLSQLIKVKSRSKYGGFELNEYLVKLNSLSLGVHERSYQPAKPEIKKSWLKPLFVTDFIAVCVYIYVNYVALKKAKKLVQRKNFVWLRDETNR